MVFMVSLVSLVQLTLTAGADGNGSLRCMNSMCVETLAVRCMEYESAGLCRRR